MWNKWSFLPNMPTKRQCVSASVVDGKIYVIGGTTEQVPWPGFQTVEVYIPNWKSLTLLTCPWHIFEPEVMLSNDGWVGKWPQRYSFGHQGPKPISYSLKKVALAGATKSSLLVRMMRSILSCTWALPDVHHLGSNSDHADREGEDPNWGERHIVR